GPADRLLAEPTPPPAPRQGGPPEGSLSPWTPPGWTDYRFLGTVSWPPQRFLRNRQIHPTMPVHAR
ncbi:MAG: hypothetical protein MK179_08080, partial [Pirellulaceae bacterium]|nr:hypothetical protein [Pirellulaceae bacterium]